MWPDMTTCFPPAGTRVLLVDQWIETGGTMKAAIQLVESLGATVVGQSTWLEPHNSMVLDMSMWTLLCFPAGVAAVAIENTEGGKWIKENYKFSHCIPKQLQSQIDKKYLESFNDFNNWRRRRKRHKNIFLQLREIKKKREK